MRLLRSVGLADYKVRLKLPQLEENPLRSVGLADYKVRQKLPQLEEKPDPRRPLTGKRQDHGVR